MTHFSFSCPTKWREKQKCVITFKDRFFFAKWMSQKNEERKKIDSWPLLTLCGRWILKTDMSCHDYRLKNFACCHSQTTCKKRREKKKCEDTPREKFFKKIYLGKKRFYILAWTKSIRTLIFMKIFLCWNFIYFSIFFLSV